MTMDKMAEVAVREVERFSKLGVSKLQQGHPQKALDAFRNAYHRSQILGRHGYMQRACAFNLGAALISVGGYSEGLTYLKQAEAPGGSSDDRSSGDLYFNCALAYEGLRNTSEMKNYYSKALKEYQTEKDNMNMEAETISRLGKLCMVAGQFEEAESYLKQLIQAFEKLGNLGKKLQAQAAMASLYLQLELVDEAEETADNCFMKAQGLELSDETVPVFIELGLVYSQMYKYNKALQCFQHGLLAVSEQKVNLKHAAVLYQNLGVTYNYLQQYQDAIQYHQAAASAHAEMKNRKSQGHCFMNLGFAYSQLNDLSRAKEYFLHSLQAAKDCGDRKSEWQSLEALATIAYHDKDLQRSQDYYKLALTILAKSQDAGDTTVQDRILGKLTSVIQLQSNKPAQPVDVTRQVEKIKAEMTKMPDQTERQDSAVSTQRKKLLRKDKTGSVIAVRKDGHIKYLRVRRSGTLRKFNKVALGLDISMSPVPGPVRKTDLDLGEEDFVFSAYTTEGSDLEDVEEEDEDDEADKQADQKWRATRMNKQYEESDSEKVDEPDSEEEEDRKLVFEAMQEVVHLEDKSLTSSKTKIIPGELSPVEGDSDLAAETGSNVDESTEKEDGGDGLRGHRRRDQILPPIPDSLPQSRFVGAMRTYEVPVKSKEHNESTEHGSPEEKRQALTQIKHTEGESVALPNKAIAEDDGNNFFHSESKELGISFIPEEEESGDRAETSHVFKNPIYETIRQPTLERHHDLVVGENSKNHSDTESEDPAEVKLPLGVRDKIEFKAHQADLKLKARHQPEVRTENTRKQSRACILM